MNHYITNIQRMCMHDGPGIRTTVFMKGCTLNCPWCSNPENISFEQEYYIDDNGKRVGIGKLYDDKKLIKELMKDSVYWDTDGGVTFSGGEPLMHMDYLEKIMCMLKSMKIHIVVETALFIPKDMLIKAISYVDLFYVDLKILEEDICKQCLGGDITNFLENFDLLEKMKKPVIIRIPCVDNYTMRKKNIEYIKMFVKDRKYIPIELFTVHNLAEKKYELLEKEQGIKLECNNNDFMSLFAELKKQGNEVLKITI